MLNDQRMRLQELRERLESLGQQLDRLARAGDRLAQSLKHRVRDPHFIGDQSGSGEQIRPTSTGNGGTQ
jgi:hypothetical protein